jgi:hypothetical protein
MENGKTIKGSMVSALVLLVNVYRFDPRLLKWKSDFEKLMLSEFDIRRLYSIFRQVDVDGSGTIEILESLMFFDIESTKFSRQVFSVMDEVRTFIAKLCPLTPVVVDLGCQWCH